MLISNNLTSRIQYTLALTDSIFGEHSIIANLHLPTYQKLYHWVILQADCLK